MMQFLGQTIVGDVNADLGSVLAAVEEDLRTTWRAENPEAAETEFLAWAGLNEPIIGRRPNAGHHTTGSAVDLNVTTCPYIVTRTGGTLGGEAGTPDAQTRRQAAVDVYDRAVAFGLSSLSKADVSIRVNDSIEVTYDRFRALSDALMFYFSWAIDATRVRVDRPPIPGVADLPDADQAFGAITEVAWSAEEGIDALRTLFADAGWQAEHPGWPLTEDEQYWQILRDFELVRTPMLFGSAGAPVLATRNPAHGFLQLRRELVCSMIRIGDQVVGGGQRTMRWGASDFGSAESGDVMHFDLGAASG